MAAAVPGGPGGSTSGREHEHDARRAGAQLGDSPKISAASATEPTGWTVSSSEVIAAGSRGSERADQQPAEHLRGQRESDQPPGARPLRRQVGVADDQPGDDAQHRRDRGRVEQRPGRADAGQTRPGAAAAGSRRRRRRPRARTARPARGRARTRRARARPRSAARRAARPAAPPAPAGPGRSDSTAHATSGTSTTWMLASTVARPGADVADRVVPQDQVGGEEHAGRQRGTPLAPGRAARGAGPRARRAAPAPAARTRSGRSPRSTARRG